MKFNDVTGVEFACPVSFTGPVDLSTATSLVGQPVYLTMSIPLYGSGVYRTPSPVAGTITMLQTNLGGEALATGDATITGKIGATAITGGVVTIAQAASALGDYDSATPSAANVVAVGSDINFTVGGTNSAEGAVATLIITITRSA